MWVSTIQMPLDGDLELPIHVINRSGYETITVNNFFKNIRNVGRGVHYLLSSTNDIRNHFLSIGLIPLNKPGIWRIILPSETGSAATMEFMLMGNNETACYAQSVSIDTSTDNVTLKGWKKMTAFVAGTNMDYVTANFLSDGRLQLAMTPTGSPSSYVSKIIFAPTYIRVYSNASGTETSKKADLS